MYARFVTNMAFYCFIARYAILKYVRLAFKYCSQGFLVLSCFTIIRTCFRCRISMARRLGLVDFIRKLSDDHIIPFLQEYEVIQRSKTCAACTVGHCTVQVYAQALDGY